MSYIGQSPTNIAFVTDTFSGTGTTTVFTMSVAPASTTSVLVAVTGVLQDPSTYSVSGTTLTFSAAPPSGTSNISVRYLGIPASGVTTTAYRTVTNFTATAGQTSFSVPSYTVGYIDVYRNGVRLVSTDFTASTGTTVVLAAGCNAGDSVVTESFYVSSVLNAIPATAGAVNSTYIAAGAVGQSALASGVAGNGPAFRARNNTSQSITKAVNTKVALQTKDFDTANCFDNTTNYRFTPNVAGYYQVNAVIAHNFSSSNGQNIYTKIYKNGSVYIMSQSAVNSAAGPYGPLAVSDLIYMNGSTDYLELYAYNDNTGPTISSTPEMTVFSASLVRSA